MKIQTLASGVRSLMVGMLDTKTSRPALVTTEMRVIISNTVLKVPMPSDLAGITRRDRYIRTWVRSSTGVEGRPPGSRRSPTSAARRRR